MKKIKKELQEFLNTINISKEDIKKYKDFTKNHSIKDVNKKNKLVKEYKKAYSYYNNSAIETEVDNVALALQSLLGNSFDERLRDYARNLLDGENVFQKRTIKEKIQYIRGFNERQRTSHYKFARLSDYVNTKTFYQKSNNNIVDLTNDFEKTPSIDEVKSYVNEIIENGTKFATLSPDWFVDIKKESSNKKQKRIVNKLLNKGNYKGLNTKETTRYNKYLASLEKLLANAEYVGEKENTKKDKKSFIEKYHYFKTDVKIGNKIYQILFDTEEYKNNKSSLSDHANKRSLEKPNEDISTINPQIAQHEKMRVLNPQSEDNIIINDNSKNFNPKTVYLYNAL